MFEVAGGDVALDTKVAAAADFGTKTGACTASAEIEPTAGESTRCLWNVWAKIEVNSWTYWVKGVSGT